MTCSVVCGSSPWERQGCGVRGLWYPPWTRCSGDGRYCHGRYVFTQGDLYRRGSVGGVGEIHDTLSWPHHRVHREPRVKSGCLVTAQIPVSLIAQCNRSWMDATLHHSGVRTDLRRLFFFAGSSVTREIRYPRHLTGS